MRSLLIYSWNGPGSGRSKGNRIRVRNKSVSFLYGSGSSDPFREVNIYVRYVYVILVKFCGNLPWFGWFLCYLDPNPAKMKRIKTDPNPNHWYLGSRQCNLRETVGRAGDLERRHYGPPTCKFKFFLDKGRRKKIIDSYPLRPRGGGVSVLCFENFWSFSGENKSFEGTRKASALKKKIDMILNKVVR